MTKELVEVVQAKRIETVTGDFLQDPGEPFWRIEIDGYCADFDYEAAANNFAAAINARIASARLSAEAAIVAWLSDKEGAWRKLTAECPDIGAPHVPRVLAEWIAEQEHRHG